MSTNSLQTNTKATEEAAIYLFLDLMKLQADLRSKRILKRRLYHEKYKRLFLQYSSLTAVPESKGILIEFHNKLQKYNNLDETIHLEIAKSASNDIFSNKEIVSKSAITEKFISVYRSSLGGDTISFESSYGSMTDMYLDIISR